MSVHINVPKRQMFEIVVDTDNISDKAVTDPKLTPTGVGGGTYTKVTVNEQGRVTLGQNPTTLAGYGITDAFGADFAKQIPWLMVGGAADAGGLDVPDASYRYLLGTPSQIVLTDNGKRGPLTLSLAEDLILPGTGAITLPSGTYDQRPAPTEGMLRYNTISRSLETPLSRGWANLVLDNDVRLQDDSNVLQVRQFPKGNEFGSIAAACNSLVAIATENDQWLIDIGPGTYHEPEIVVPSYVHVSGFTEYAVYVRPDSDDHPVFTLSPSSTVSFLNVAGAIGYQQAAFRLYDTSTSGVIIHKVCIEDAFYGFDIRAIDDDCTAYIEYCDTTQNFGIGVNVSLEASHIPIGHAAPLFKTYVNLENFYVYGDVTNPAMGINVNGPNVYMNLQTFGMEGVDGTGEAFNLANGGRMDVKAGSVFGWDVGVHLENTGLPSIGNFDADFADNTTWDLFSEHPDNNGSLTGTATRTKVNAIASPQFTSAFADVSANEFVITGDLVMGKTQANLTSVSDLILETAPLGLLSGGQLSADGNTVIVQPGVGYLRKDGAVARVEWDLSLVPLAPGQTAYIAVNKNGEVITSPTMPDDYSNVHLGRATGGATEISSLGALTINIANHGNVIEDYLRSAVGPVFVSGSIVTENATTPRAIDVTAGMFYYGTSTSRPDAKVAAMMVDIHRQNGQLALTPTWQVPNDTLDNGTNLVPMTPGYYAKHALYTISEGAYQAFYLSHAQLEYATLEAAIAAPIPVPRISPDATPTIAAIIVQQGTNHIVDILDIRPMFMRAIQGTSGGTSDHGDLLGLADDDHKQYMLTTGARPWAGDVDFAGNDILNIGLINGLNITKHGARHSPQGADPIPTGPGAQLTPSSTNGTGTSNFLSRSDHTHAITGFQPASSELTALTTISGVGFAVHSHGTAEPVHSWVTRTLSGVPGRITIENSDGDAGNPIIDLVAAGTPGTYAQVTTDVFGRVVSGSNTMPFANITNRPTTLSGYGITDAQLEDDILTTLSNISGSGIFVITGDGSATTRAVTAPPAGLTITNGDGIAGDPTISLANDLAAVEGLTGTGIAVRIDVDTWVTRAITTPTDGLVVTQGSGLGGNIVLGLEKDMAAVEALAGTGFAVRTGANTWATRSLQGTAGNITISVPAGTTGDPVINLATAGAAGTYRSVTTDAFGRVTAGTNPNSLAGYGITDAVSTTLLGVANGVATLDGAGKLPQSQLPALAITDTFIVGSVAAMTALTAEVGDVAVRTDVNRSFILRAAPASTATNWQELLTPTDAVLSVNGQTGAVVINTGVMSLTQGTGITITGTTTPTVALSTIGTAGTYRSITTDAYGRVTAGTNPTTIAGYGLTDAVSTAQLGAVSGVATLDSSGKLTPAQVPALATVGTPGTYRSVTTDAFGRVTAGTNPTTLAGYGITDALSSNDTVVTPGTYEKVIVNAAGQVIGGINATSVSKIGQVIVGSVVSQSGTSTIIPGTNAAPTTAMGTLLLSQAITPSSTSARIMFEMAGLIDTTAVTNAGVYITVFRGSTFIGAAFAGTQASGYGFANSFALRIVDTPGSTASQTYTVRIGASAASTWYLGRIDGNTLGGNNRTGWAITEIL